MRYTDSKLITLWMPVEHSKKLKAQAKEECCPYSEIIRKAIRAHLDALGGEEVPRRASDTPSDDMVHVSLKIPVTLLEELNKEAKLRVVPVSSIVRAAVRQALEAADAG